MGEHDVSPTSDERSLRAFMGALLDDVDALERMLAEGWIESGVRRIGAEQEMFLVDRACRPVRLATRLLSRLRDPRFTTELGLFNLEVNLSPRRLEGGGLREMESELAEVMGKAASAAAAFDARVALTGILPTLGKEHLSLDWMTPEPRFRILNRVTVELRGEDFLTRIRGLDEFEMAHENVMLEAFTASFQVHLQVGAEEFPRLYNAAQVAIGPVLAAAANSPLLLGHRLWPETRIALFQQAIDTRSEARRARAGRPRVSFGEEWVRESILEIYREDIARFRVMLSTEPGPTSLELLERGEVPPLEALCVHNGTVYRWNRPCYGVFEGRPHLRIEARALPAGPTPLDEIANGAFFFGLVVALAEELGDVTRVFSFDDAKANFVAAARQGLDAQLLWTGSESLPARGLLHDRLLPLAREGLRAAKVDAASAERYLSVIDARVSTNRNGARWALESLAGMGQERSPDERLRALVAGSLSRQMEGGPVHTWTLARLEEHPDWRASYRTVRQVMTTDLFTVGPEDLIDLAASVMEWRHVRHVPVEDKNGRLVGLLSSRSLLRLVGRGRSRSRVAVREIMIRDPVTVSPDASTREAIALLRRHGIGCLPVVEDGSLVGVLTASDFLSLANVLLDEALGTP